MCSVPGTTVESGDSAVKKTRKIKSSENKIISDVERIVKERKLGNGL